jgi:hypothetical protein
MQTIANAAGVANARRVATPRHRDRRDRRERAVRDARDGATRGKSRRARDAKILAPFPRRARR